MRTSCVFPLKLETSRFTHKHNLKHLPRARIHCHRNKQKNKHTYECDGSASLSGEENDWNSVWRPLDVVMVHTSSPLSVIGSVAISEIISAGFLFFLTEVLMREDEKISIELCGEKKTFAWISLRTVVQSDCNNTSLLLKGLTTKMHFNRQRVLFQCVWSFLYISKNISSFQWQLNKWLKSQWNGLICPGSNL